MTVSNGLTNISLAMIAYGVSTDYYQQAKSIVKNQPVNNKQNRVFYYRNTSNRNQHTPLLYKSLFAQAAQQQIAFVQFLLQMFNVCVFKRNHFMAFIYPHISCIHLESFHQVYIDYVYIKKNK